MPSSGKYITFIFALKLKQSPFACASSRTLPPGVLPIMAYTGKLRQKGTFVFFRLQAYVKLGRDFTHELKYMKG